MTTGGTDMAGKSASEVCSVHPGGGGSAIRGVPWVRFLLLAVLIAVTSILVACGTSASTTPGADNSTSTSASVVSSPSTATHATSPEDFPTFALSDVAYVELIHPSLLIVSAEGRRILSPIAEAADVQSLLHGYSGAGISIAGDSFPADKADLQVVVHLQDGSALEIMGLPNDTELGFAVLWDGSIQSEQPGMQGDSIWSKEIVAPELLAEARRIIGQTAQSQEGAHLSAAMPDDFGFVAAFGVYGKMVLDTFAGEFYKDMVLPPFTIAAAPLALSEAELEQAYRGLVSLDVLAYPSDFVPKENGWMTPNSEYYLRLRANGIEKEIRWDDGSSSLEPRATALREWFKKLSDLIDAKPEYKALPDFRGGYA